MSQEYSADKGVEMVLIESPDDDKAGVRITMGRDATAQSHLTPNPSPRSSIDGLHHSWTSIGTSFKVPQVEIKKNNKGNSRPQKQPMQTDTQMSTDAKEQREREPVKGIDEALDKGDLDMIKKIVTAEKLTCADLNSLEKSLEVSYRLRILAHDNKPDAEDFNTLANRVEEFAVELLDPLKCNDIQRSIFEGKDFDRIAEKAVFYQQKKFVSHPVVYNLLMRRWAGSFHNPKLYSWTDLKTCKWLLLNLWTIFDFLFFPLVFTILYLVHLVILLVKRRQVIKIVLLSNASLEDDYIRYMERLSEMIRKDGPRKANYASITCIKSRPQITICNFQSQDSTIATSELEQFLKDLFLDLDSFKQKKILVVATDNKVDKSLLNVIVEYIKKKGVYVISVGFGVKPEMKQLRAMGTSQEDVILYQGETILEDVGEKVIEKIHGYDIFDRYYRYFVTPYFIFVRDTLSYLVLLSLHFAMCLQPSTLYFTTIEWIILFFFIGRLLTEIYQVVIERRRSNKIKTACAYEDREKTQSRKYQNKDSGGLFNTSSKYFCDWWNVLDLITLLIFIVILILRSFTWAKHLSVPENRFLAVAGYLYGLNTLFLTLRVFGHIMESSNRTGSIQIALFQIIGAVLAIFGQFIAATLAFSLAITKVYVAEMSYNAPKNSSSHGFCKANEDGIACLSQSATHLIWSLLGDTSADPMDSLDPASDLLAKLLYGTFLVMAVVMLMNMMIALLSNTYQKVEDNAFYEWSYRKATTIHTYLNYHPVPVPFNIISLAVICIWRIIKFLRNRISQESNNNKKYTHCGQRKSFFDSLVLDLQEEYFSERGNSLPISESSKIDRVLRENKGNHQLIGQIAKQTFKYSKKEARELLKDLENPKDPWDARGIDIQGHQLTYTSCQCDSCEPNPNPTKYHGARFRKQLSEKWPGFEVLINESGRQRFIALGVVTEEYNLHKFPGWGDNTAGYHIDDGKIFDINHCSTGRECEDAMAQRGDLIGCKISYDRPARDNTLTVSFTLNGRVIGEGRVNVKDDTGAREAFYPFVGMGFEGISVLFKMCSSDKDQDVLEKDNSDQMLKQIHKKLDNLEKKIEELHSYRY